MIFHIRSIDTVKEEISDIFLFPSNLTELTIQGKLGNIFWLEQAIIRPVTRILKRKIKTASRCEQF
jgi:hypothetical protein